MTWKRVVHNGEPQYHLDSDIGYGKARQCRSGPHGGQIQWIATDCADRRETGYLEGVGIMEARAHVERLLNLWNLHTSNTATPATPLTLSST